MITLMTGLPGAGKTLYTLSQVDAISKRDNRPVFYSGISGLNIEGWTEINAEEWYTCPPNSLIVIDECQRIFRPRTISKDVPLYVSELETHRHKGLDLWMITQHPMLADSALRRLAGKHIHAIRPFGFQGSSLHEWASVKDTCDKSSGRLDSIKSKWAYDKTMFAKYKSAEVHTVKRAIPLKVKIALALPLLIGLLVFYFYKSVDSRVHPKDATGAALVAGQAGTSPGAGGAKASFKNARDDAAQYVFERTPRISNWEASEPRYDELTKPVRVPLPAACVASSRGCKCFSQQATPVNVTEATCKSIVENGFFQDFDDGSGGQSKQGNERGRVERVAERSVAEPVRVSSAVDAGRAGVVAGVGVGAVSGVRTPGAGAMLR